MIGKTSAGEETTLIMDSYLPDTRKEPREKNKVNTRAEEQGGLALSPGDLGEQRQQESPWLEAQRLLEDDGVVKAVVSGHNRGGLLVDWRGLPGFVPASQLIGLPRLHLETERTHHLEQRCGETLRLKVIEVRPEARRLIFSERATQVDAQERDQLFHELAPGQVRQGVVTNLAVFGAFVDLGGVEGLIHVSQLSWRRLNHPSDAVQPGDRLEVLVLNVELDEGRVALSRKRLVPDPWRDVETRYAPGQVVDGVVSNVTDFGVFLLVEEELEGLVHRSELANGREGAPAVLPQKGEQVQARVLHVSEIERRLGLSMRLAG